MTSGLTARVTDVPTVPQSAVVSRRSTTSSSDVMSALDISSVLRRLPLHKEQVPIAQLSEQEADVHFEQVVVVKARSRNLRVPLLKYVKWNPPGALKSERKEIDRVAFTTHAVKLDSKFLTKLDVHAGGFVVT